MMNNENMRETLTDKAPFPFSEKDAVEFISGTLSSKEGSQYVFAILYSGEVVGTISAHRGEDVYRLGCIMGYYIAEPHWGKGIMTEALQQMCDYLFIHTDLTRIEACAWSNNPSSCRVLEKGGFQHEGTLRQCVIKKGKMLDSELYSLLKTEWQSQFHASLRPTHQAEHEQCTSPVLAPIRQDE
jgi:RimJ/RimL family protein N-acetyltransferase